MVVRIPDREVGDLAEQIRTEGEYRCLRDLCGSKALQHRHQRASHVDDQHQHEVFHKAVEIHMELSVGQGDRVDGFALQLRSQEGEKRRNKGGDHDRDDEILALADVLHQLDDRPLDILRFFPDHGSARSAMVSACAVFLLECAQFIGRQLPLTGCAGFSARCAIRGLTVRHRCAIREFLFVRHYAAPPSVFDFICEW